MEVIVKNLLLTLLIILQAGCASTNVSSFRDPSIQDKTYKCIIIFVNESNLAYRRQMENALSDKLLNYGVKGLKAIDFILPTRQYTVEQLNETIKNTKAEAILAITINNAHANTNYIPTGDGMVPITTSSAIADIALFDILSGKTVWIANANINCNGLPWNDSISAMINSGSDAVVEKMKEDKLLNNEKR